MHLVHNARVTLFATILNTMAGSSYTVGVAAPIATTFFYNAASLKPSLVFGGAAIWFSITIMLHIAAQRSLGGLRE